MSTLTIPRATAPAVRGTRRRSLARTYRYVRRHPVGRWLLLVVWVGLGVALASPYVALIPIALERREVLRAAGVRIDETNSQQKEPPRDMTPEQKVPFQDVDGTYSGTGTTCDDRTFEMGVRFSYTSAEPYALHLTLWVVGEYDQARTWTVSREVLHVACMWGSDIAPAGADFSAAAAGPHGVRLRFQASDPHERQGHLDLLMGRGEVLFYLARTLHVVPAGSEADHLDFDGELARLFAN